MLMWARSSCPSWRVSRLAVLAAACALSYMLAVSTAHASDPLGGQSITVPTAPAAVQNAVAPAVTTVRHTAATVRHTAERSAAAVAPAAPVADVAGTADHVVTPVVERTVQSS